MKGRLVSPGVVKILAGLLFHDSCGGKAIPANLGVDGVLGCALESSHAAG